MTLDPSPVKPGDLAKFVIKAESGGCWRRRLVGSCRRRRKLTRAGGCCRRPAGKAVRGGSVQMVVHYAGMPVWTQVKGGHAGCVQAAAIIGCLQMVAGVWESKNGACASPARPAANRLPAPLTPAAGRLAVRQGRLPHRARPHRGGCWAAAAAAGRALAGAAAWQLRPAARRWRRCPRPAATPCPCNRPFSFLPAPQVRYAQLFPGITPPGSYSVTLNGHSGDDQLFCVTLPFQVGPSRRSARSRRSADSSTSRAAAVLQHRLHLQQKHLHSAVPEACPADPGRPAPLAAGGAAQRR